MKAIIKPSRAAGVIEAPPSKSMAHRMLICAGLSKGESIVHGIAPSRDVLATLDCLEALGAKYKYENDTVVISGVQLDETQDGTVLNCCECGSTLRFFIPIALLTGKRMDFTGSETLLSRPLGVYEELCKNHGFLFERSADKITVCGNLRSGEYEVAGNVSSQFISGLLFALSYAGGSSLIKIIPPVESRPYIDMTLQAINEFGIDANWNDENTLRIAGGAGYSPRETKVEGDYSNAAFFEALNLAGGDVTVTGLKEDSLQGDKIYKELFKKIGGSDVIDISNCPDLGPILMAAAAMKGETHFTGTKRLRIKESDRGEAMKAELEKFGVKTEIGEDEIIVYGGRLSAPESELSGHNDHRIVMSLSVISSITGGVIEGAQAVNKSFPDFFDKLKKLGIEVSLSGMDK